MNYNPAMPSIADMAAKARKRIPAFAVDYLESGIGGEFCLRRNRGDLDNVILWPRYLCDVGTVNTQCRLFDHDYDLGIGVAPVGLGNMMWPNGETRLARAAQAANIPYIYSTMGTTALEDIAAIAPDVAWFQLYVPREGAIMRDLIERAGRAGFKALVVTVDIPVGAKRDRELKNGLILPFRITPRLVAQAMRCPLWTLLTLRHGMPRFMNLLPYSDSGDIKHLGEFLTHFFCPGVSIERLQEIRSLWQGPLIIKGLQRGSDISAAADLGADGVILSNHAGRQLDAAPSSIAALQALPSSLRERMTVMLDSGIRSGLDVVRARALGASAVFSGRSFMYALAAAGADGPRQAIEIFRDEITRTLQQLGCMEFEAMDATWTGSGERGTGNR